MCHFLKMTCGLTLLNFRLYSSLAWCTLSHPTISGLHLHLWAAIRRWAGIVLDLINWKIWLALWLQCEQLEYVLQYYDRFDSNKHSCNIIFYHIFCSNPNLYRNIALNCTKAKLENSSQLYIHIKLVCSLISHFQRFLTCCSGSLMFKNNVNT